MTELDFDWTDAGDAEDHADNLEELNMRVGKAIRPNESHTLHFAAQCIRRLQAENEALREALREVMDRDMRNTCQHEETHRAGTMWEICTSCGAMWADDEGGKPEWQDPPEWTKAYKALAANNNKKEK